MLLKKLYPYWVIFGMTIIFSTFIVPLCLCATIHQLHKTALVVNKVCARSIFILLMIPVKTKWHFKPTKNQRYILCANHFSYLDIPALALFPRSFKFVGKIQLAKMPLFGYMYNRIHITVNRSSIRSRGKALLKGREAIRDGYCLGFFPEGGIRSKKFPEMVQFQDGAFRLAAETRTPIVPVTFPNNFKILSDSDIMNIRPGTCRIIYHQPIFAKGDSETDIKELKEKVFHVIQSTLNTTTDYKKPSLVEIS